MIYIYIYLYIYGGWEAELVRFSRHIAQRTHTDILVAFKNTNASFLIACVTACCKCISDVYSTNAFFAKVGGISTQELNIIEIELCKLLDWRLQCSAALLQEYYNNLVLTNPRYERQGTDSTPSLTLSPQSPLKYNQYLDTELVS
jgi:hypothetical protein